MAFEYGSSANLGASSGDPDLPFAQPVVVSTVLSDGRPTTPVIVDEYEYRDGVYDRAEREFRGFGTVIRSKLLDDGSTEGVETSVTHS